MADPENAEAIPFLVCRSGSPDRESSGSDVEPSSRDRPRRSSMRSPRSSGKTRQALLARQSRRLSPMRKAHHAA